MFKWFQLENALATLLWIPKIPGCTFLVSKGAVFLAHGRERLLLSCSWGQLLISSTYEQHQKAYSL